jgi:hypothetical protein
MSHPKTDIGLELFSLLGADRECPLPIKGRDGAVANFRKAARSGLWVHVLTLGGNHALSSSCGIVSMSFCSLTIEFCSPSGV